MRLRAVGACRGRRAERLRGARRRRLLLGLEVDPEAPGGLRGHPGPPWWASDRRSEVFQSGGAEADVHVGSADDGQGLAVQTERGGGHGLLGSVSALRLLVPRTCLGLPLIGGDLESGSGGVCGWPVRRVRRSGGHLPASYRRTRGRRGWRVRPLRRERRWVRCWSSALPSDGPPSWTARRQRVSWCS